MTARYQHLRRIDGAPGSPPASAGIEGMIALNLAGAPGIGTAIELWAHDGAGWRLLRAGVPVGTLAPVGPANGDLWVDTSQSPPALRAYNGSVWVPVGSMPIASTTAPSNPIQGQLWADVTGGSGSLLLKGWNGVAWETINAAVTTQSLDLTSQNAAADVGAAYTAAGAPALTGTIVIATWGSPVVAYLLTNRAAPGNAASWTSLGGSVGFATPAEVLAGTAAGVAINPLGLQSRTLAAPTGTPANDAGYLPRLNAAGKIDPGFLSISGVAFRGAADFAATVPLGTHSAGDFYYHNGAAGAAIDASWGQTAGAKADPGDLALYDGTAWHIIQGNLDPNAFVARAGTNLIAGSMTMSWSAPASPTAIIDGGDPAKSKIDNVTIDAGDY